MNLPGLHQGVSGLCSFFGGSLGKSVFLPFPDSRGCPHSFLYILLPTSKPAMAIQVFLILHR